MGESLTEQCRVKVEGLRVMFLITDSNRLNLLFNVREILLSFINALWLVKGFVFFGNRAFNRHQANN